MKCKRHPTLGKPYMHAQFLSPLRINVRRGIGNGRAKKKKKKRSYSAYLRCRLHYSVNLVINFPFISSILKKRTTTTTFDRRKVHNPNLCYLLAEQRIKRAIASDRAKQHTNKTVIHTSYEYLFLRSLFQFSVKILSLQVSYKPDPSYKQIQTLSK